MAGPRIIMAAGGTGGHLWPALSLARAIKRLRPEAEFLFIGAGRPLEAKMIDPEGFRRVTLSSSGFKGRGLMGRIRALAQCFSAVLKARRIMADFQPDLCFGAGGYVTVPVGLAAWLRGTPLAIHEQNSRPGLSNKFLSRLAALVMVGFPGAAKVFPAAKTRVVGNPVREEIAEVGRGERPPRACPQIAVTGGSQGASGLNSLAGPALVALKEAGLDFEVFHQSGEKDQAELSRMYAEAGLKAEVVDFCRDMVGFYRRADLVIGRAGAITIAELAASGRASILVPLPTAADDHQSVNAAQMSEAGAALVMSEREGSAEALAGMIKGLLAKPEKIEEMARAALGQARPAADERMAALCLEKIEGRKAPDYEEVH